MPQIRSFAAVRYNLEHVRSIDEVIAPRAAEIGWEQREALYKQHPANVVRVIANRPELGDEPGDAIRRSGKFLRQWASEGVTVRDPLPAIYVLRQGAGGANRLAVFGRLRLEPKPERFRGEEESSERLSMTGHNATPVLAYCPELDLESLVGTDEEPSPIIESTSETSPFCVRRIVDKDAIVRLERALSQARITSMENEPITESVGSEEFREAIAYQRLRRTEQGGLDEDDLANYVMVMVADRIDSKPDVMSGLLFNPVK